MEDSPHDSGSEDTIQYTVTVNGDEEDQRVFRDVVREEGAEIQSELPINTDEQGTPQYLRELIDEGVKLLEEEENEDVRSPIEAAMDIVIPKVKNLPVENDVSERSVFDVLQDLQRLEALETEDSIENIDEGASPFNNYRHFHSPNNPKENEWGEATLKALTHASLEMYIVRQLESMEDIETRPNERD